MPFRTVKFPFARRCKSAVAGHKAVSQDGDALFSWGTDDAAAGYADCIAAQSHHHAQSLLTTGTGTAEAAVHLECDTR